MKLRQLAARHEGLQVAEPHQRPTLVEPDDFHLANLAAVEQRSGIVPIVHRQRPIDRDDHLAFRAHDDALDLGADLDVVEKALRHAEQVVTGDDAFLLGADVEDELVLVLADDDPSTTSPRWNVPGK